MKKYLWLIILVIALAVGIYILTKKASGSGAKFKVGDYLQAPTHLPTDVVYKVMAVHMDAKKYDMAQWFQGQAMPTQIGFDMTVIDANYEKITKPA